MKHRAGDQDPERPPWLRTAVNRSLVAALLVVAVIAVLQAIDFLRSGGYPVEQATVVSVEEAKAGAGGCRGVGDLVFFVVESPAGGQAPVFSDVRCSGDLAPGDEVKVVRTPDDVRVDPVTDARPFLLEVPLAGIATFLVVLAVLSLLHRIRSRMRPRGRRRR